jgi:hypothetical protein
MGIAPNFRQPVSDLLRQGRCREVLRFDSAGQVDALMPIIGVRSRQYLFVLAGFAVLIAGGFLLDRLVVPACWVIAAFARGNSVDTLLRAGLGGFFVVLCAIGGMILASELKTEAEWPARLQLGIAAGLFSARSCFLRTAGILLLMATGPRSTAPSTWRATHSSWGLPPT